MEKYRVIISREMFNEKHLIIIIILDRMIKEKKEPASSFISEKSLILFQMFRNQFQYCESHQSLCFYQF
ncbi:hypothetical protein TW93_17330 [Bacillus pumilus]|nr:hypothetical protein TW93_17330 [Bacillus pumilus]